MATDATIFPRARPASRDRARLWRLAAIIGVLVFACGSARHSAGGSVYYVSTRGSDTATGRSATASGADGPFATIERAVKAMRADGSAGTVVITAGTYRLNRPILLTARDSGAVITAATGEAVVLSGGEAVTGWRSEGNGIYSAPMTKPTGLELTVGDVRQRVAQTGDWQPGDPNSGWLQATGGMRSSFTYRKGDLPKNLYVPDLYAETYHSGEQGRGWTDSIDRVTAIDAKSNTVLLSGNVPWALDRGALYRLMNNPGFVKHDGDFAWRDRDRRLVYKTDDPDFEAKGVVVPRLDRIIEIDGASDVTIRGLIFADTTWQMRDARRDNNFTLIGIGAVALNRSDRIAVDHNTFTNVGEAVSLDRSSHNRISGNLITHTANSGIELRANSNGNAITNNSITSVGEFYTNAGGIFWTNSSENAVSHNLIQHTPQPAIKQMDAGSDVNIGNVIEYNKILFSNEQTGDEGAIYALGRSSRETQTTIRYNWIANTGLSGSLPWGWAPKTHGIYLDDFLSGCTIHGNLIEPVAANPGNAAIFVHGGKNIGISNNVVILDGQDFLRLQGIRAGAGGGNIRVERNLVYATRPQPNTVYWWLDGRVTVDRNLYFNVPKVPGQDGNSITDDPLFVDRGTQDYRLQSASPAARLDFADLPYPEMGLTDHRPGASGAWDRTAAAGGVPLLERDKRPGRSYDR